MIIYLCDCDLQYAGADALSACCSSRSSHQPPRISNVWCTAAIHTVTSWEPTRLHRQSQMDERPNKALTHGHVAHNILPLIVSMKDQDLISKVLRINMLKNPLLDVFI